LYQHSQRHLFIKIKTAKMKAEIVKNGKEQNLVITLPLDMNGVASASGKTKVHASTRGNVKTSIEINGKPLTIGVNAYAPVN
jgi:hypothetical protein